LTLAISRTCLATLLLAATAGMTANAQLARPREQADDDPATLELSGIHPLLKSQVDLDLGLPASVDPNASSKTLTYYGGPVLQNVKMQEVAWNSKVQSFITGSATLATTIPGFLKGITTGQYMTFLSQYSTTSPKQTIGNGSSLPLYIDTQTSTNVTDAQIQAEISHLISTSKVPAPDANMVYAFFFPYGTKITTPDGSLSCVQFCAYHGTFKRNGVNVNYEVMPDLSNPGCNTGCGASTLFNNTTSVLSHEFAETVTDPAVGLATVYGPPLAWYNATYGEVGDICNGQQGSTVLSNGHTYTVQKLWSNKANACVIP
jgi:hypothetical protein